jgi:hypothetical protein
MDALDAAGGDRRLPDDDGGRALRTAMASQIMAPLVTANAIQSS